MKKIRFGLIGTGWRADFFLRIAKEMPEQFELTNMLSRSEEKAAAYAKEWGIATTTKMDDVLAAKPDFVILCISHFAFEEYIKVLGDAGMPILCETPPASNREALYRIWDYVQANNVKIQVAEQYHFWPLYASVNKIIEKGMIGEVSNMRLAALHGYHAVAVFRRVFGAGMKGVSVKGERFTFPVVETDSRYGIVTSGEMGEAVRDVITLKWEDGKVAFFDFAGKNYHSAIRTRSLNVQGSHGEINDFDVRYVNADGLAVTSTMVRADRGVHKNNGLSHQHMTLNGEVLFENPHMYKRFNDDEISMATCMLGMQEYIETGKDACYSLANAMQDALIAIAMTEAVTTGETITLGEQPWAK
ncbi:MAG: Gfo/Idh/MocA family oxidoreductase [Faecalibacterium sp.]